MVKRVTLILFLLIVILSNVQSADAELVNHSEVIEFDGVKVIKTISYEIRINNKAGEKYAEITIPYSKLVNLSNLKATLKDAFGVEVRKLKGKEIIDRNRLSNASFYSDERVKEFRLKHSTYPYSIVYSYKTHQTEFLYLVNWYPVLDEQIPTQNAMLKVSVPISCSIMYQNNLVDEPLIDTVESRINYTWNTQYKNIIAQESYSPPLVQFLPHVEVVPQKFHFESEGSHASWDSYALWEHSLIKNQNVLPDSEKEKLDNLTKGLETEVDKIKALYHYLQDGTRYINVTIETGGLKPYPASYVAQNKYGDCKALTNYMKSMLEYIGIPAIYTNVYAGNPIKKIDKTFPSQQFNHVILCVPNHNDTIWLECTSDGPFNYLGTFTQDRDVFLIDQKSHFTKTPALSPINNHDARTVTVTYEKMNLSRIEFNNRYTGYMFELLSQVGQDYDEKDNLKIMQRYIIENELELVSHKLIKQHRDSTNIQLIYQANSRNIYKEYGNDIVVNNIPLSLPKLEQPSKRKLPLVFNYPIYKTDTLYYNVPAGYALSSKLVNTFIVEDFGSYYISFKQIDQQIVVTKKLIINSGYYTNEIYPAIHTFISKVNGLENKSHIAFSKR